MIGRTDFKSTPGRERIVDDLDDRSANIPIRYSITSYGADYPVDGLVGRIESGAIYVPDFQRKYVWPIRLASRFIESLLLGLPVPGIFLARERDSARLIVIDGQQRLGTLHSFYTGISHGSRKEFGLDLNNPGYQSPYHGATYKTLSRDDQQRLDDSILHATVIRQDEPSDDQSSIYTIFERLNTGGVNLQPQEIRASIFHGPFSQLLGSLNENAHWRHLYGAKNIRLRDQELILRFFAFMFILDEYRRPMKEFLNIYMGRNRNLDQQSEEELRVLFASTVVSIDEQIGKYAFKPEGPLNAAVYDAVMFGVAGRLAKGPISDRESLSKIHGALLVDPEFISVSSRATADELSVRRRLELASKAFSQAR